MPIRQLVGFDTEKGFHPKVGLVPIPPAAPEEFWSARDAIATMVELGWLDAEAWYSARDNTAMATRLIEAGWVRDHIALLPVLLHNVDVQRIPGHELRKMRDLVEDIEAEAAFDPDSGLIQRALRCRANVSSQLDDVDGMLAAVGRQAARCADRWADKARSMTDEAPAMIAFELLLEAALHHASSLPRTVAARMMVFAQALRIVAESWPQAAPSVVEILDAVIRQAPTEAAANLWPILFDLRAIYY